MHGSRFDRALDGMIRFAIILGSLSEADNNLLNKRLDILGVDISRFIAKELKIPDAFILDEVDKLTNQLLQRFLDIAKRDHQFLGISKRDFRRKLWPVSLLTTNANSVRRRRPLNSAEHIWEDLGT